MNPVEGFNAESLARRSRTTAIVTLLGALLTLAVLIYASIELSRLMSRVEAKRIEVSRLERTVSDRQVQIGELEGNIGELQGEIDNLKRTLEGSRQAVAFVRDGINAYHQGAYSTAVRAYDAALRLDPENAYVLNLKGYSLFKLRQFDEAIAALKAAVDVQPDYAWGYFDLARAYCARKDFDLAKEARSRALALRPGLAGVMSGDGEFTRLCRPIL